MSSFDANSITSLSQYVKPLTNFLEKLLEGEKVLGKLSIFITNGLIYSILIIYLYWLCSILITSENNFFVNFLSIYSLLFFFGFLSRWSWLDMILEGYVYHMQWRCFLLRFPRLSLLLQQCWLMDKALLILFLNRFFISCCIFIFTCSVIWNLKISPNKLHNRIGKERSGEGRGGDGDGETL